MTTTTLSAVRTRRTGRSFLEGQEIVLIIVIAAIWALLAIVTDTFMTGASIQSTLYNAAPLAIIGVGMTAVMVTAGIDVSVGSQLAIVMALVGLMLRDSGLGFLPAALLAVFVGLFLGAVNGSLIVFGRIHPMIVTFGTLNVFRFVALQIFGDKQISGVPATLKALGGSIDAVTFGVPNAMWLALALVVVQWVRMRQWAGGRHLYAIGNDEGAARLAGIRVSRSLLLTYVVLGGLVGVAALVQLGSGGLIQQNVGLGIELQVIAACVIGGTSVTGGRGTVIGTVLGALLVSTVTSAVIHLRWPSELTNLVIGVFIVVAVGIDLIRKNRRNAS